MTREYLVVYCKGKRNWGGYSPDVPGCISTGDSLPHMRSMMREALEGHLEVTAEYGEPIPEATTFNVDFEPEDWEGVEYFIVERLAVKLPRPAKQPRRKASTRTRISVPA
jgi:predicted RNase H-like HicB family nuclease